MNNRYKVVDVKRRYYSSSINVLYTIKDINTEEEFSCYIDDRLDGSHKYIRWLDEDGNIFDLVLALVDYDDSIYELLDGEIISPDLEKCHKASNKKSNYKSEEEYLKVYNKEEKSILKKKTNKMR